MQGQTYAIPTKDKDLNVLSIMRIKPYITYFINFVKDNPQLHFLVTEIGCGLAGYDPVDIAPMFIGTRTLKNISLPNSFRQILNF